MLTLFERRYLLALTWFAAVALWTVGLLDLNVPVGTITRGEYAVAAAKALIPATLSIVLLVTISRVFSTLARGAWRAGSRVTWPSRWTWWPELITIVGAAALAGAVLASPYDADRPALASIGAAILTTGLLALRTHRRRAE